MSADLEATSTPLKRSKRDSSQIKPTKPDVALGIAYWQTVPATVNGVLGGYGLGTLPRVDALGSRTFLLNVLPRLSSVAPVTEDPVKWKKAQLDRRGGKGKTVTRALDCGAGVGRVTENVLLRIVDEVHVAEPVQKFLLQAYKKSSEWQSLTLPIEKQPFQARKSAHFHLSTLQSLDPARPWSTADGGIYEEGVAASTKGPGSDLATKSKRLKAEDVQDTDNTIPPRFSPLNTDSEEGHDEERPSEPLAYDVIWCQWMLQHLSDPDLKAFLIRAKAALVAEDGVIVVKENVCSENENGTERVWWDDEDKSITRSTKAYERVFAEAGLKVVRSEVQLGLPAELFVVKMWALR